MRAEQCRPGETIVCIGTSPAMLFEGLRLASGGCRIIFLDRADGIGGGWRVRDLFGYAGVEVGAHLFENRKNTFEMLHSILGKSGLDTNASGFGLIEYRRISLRTARTLLYTGLTAKALARRSYPEFIHAWSNLTASIINWRTPMVYPQGGIGRLLDGLYARLIEKGAEFRFRLEIESVEAGSSGVVLRSSDMTLEADRVVLSSRAHAPLLGGEQYWKDLRETRVDSMVMLLDESALAFQGYVEIFSNPVLKRVRRLDISSADRHHPLVVFQLRAPPKDLHSDAKATLTEAARIGLLRHGIEPEAIHHEQCVFKTLPACRLAAIVRGSGGRVQTIQTIDFSDPRPRVGPL